MSGAVHRLATVVVAMSGLLGALSCREPLDDNLSDLTALRLVAIRSEPAEAEPGDDVRLSALVVGHDGVLAAADVDWAFCLAPKPPGEVGTINRACLLPTGPALQPIGVGLVVDATLPDDGCQLFGPDPPPPEDGSPGGRPVDPDPSGGYHQPARLGLPGGTQAIAVGSTRIACGVAGATPEAAAELRRSYRRNENPAVAALVWRDVDGDVALPSADDPEAPEVVVPAGASLTLRAAWPACPAVPVCGDGVCSTEEGDDCPDDCDAPRGCGGAEDYLVYDRARKVLATRRESVRAAWYTTGGVFAQDHTGRDEAATLAGATTTDDVWHVPDTPGEVHLVVVLGDDRGGVGWSVHRVTVAPP